MDKKGFRDSDDSEESEHDKINNLSDLSDDEYGAGEEGEEELSEIEEEVAQQQGASKKKGRIDVEALRAEAKRQAAIKKATEQYDEMHEDSDGSIIGFSEEGELEMEEGEFEMEEGECELSEDEEEAQG